MRSLKPRRSVSAARQAPPRRPVKRVSAIKNVKAHAHAEESATPLANVGFFQQGLLSPHQKRELILAHATAREARHVPHSWFYIMGVAVSCLVVVGGWWLTVGGWIRSQITVAARPNIQQDIRQEMANIEAQYPLQKPNFAEAKAMYTSPLPSSTTTSIGE